MSASDESGFLARWARRKAEAQRGAATTPVVPATAAQAAPAPMPASEDARGTPAAAAPAAGPETKPPAGPRAAPAPTSPATPAPPPPTLDDVARLTRDSDFSRFVAGDVEPGVRNAAMKKLFSDPHFNVMDGLDVYIDDYGKPDPIPPGMLRRLAQSRFLGLFDDEVQADPVATRHGDAVAAPDAQPAPTDEDPDLRLQPDDAAGREDGEPHRPGAREDPAGQR